MSPDRVRRAALHHHQKNVVDLIALSANLAAFFGSIFYALVCAI
jgi:hypothetical protein